LLHCDLSRLGMIPSRRAEPSMEAMR
jgi:hypothetical protein